MQGLLTLPNKHRQPETGAAVLNQPSKIWTRENSSCVTKKEYLLESCTVSNMSRMCTSKQLDGAGSNDEKNSSVSVPENRSAEPEELSPEGSPESNAKSPPVFHTGSFIGGGVLVILLETVGYVVLKHLRGPDRDYQTMEETPQ
ncbi:CD164 sialomucin-like 2 protein [Phyllobates terribilis]|uniref:CD164 sialomucin-like 2 protein n=1 Tax=Phyllobates terribilis TaxID=111132 RepID=UPI003CCB086C